MIERGLKLGDVASNIESGQKPDSICLRTHPMLHRYFKSRDQGFVKTMLSRGHSPVFAERKGSEITFWFDTNDAKTLDSVTRWNTNQPLPIDARERIVADNLFISYLRCDDFCDFFKERPVENAAASSSN